MRTSSSRMNERRSRTPCVVITSGDPCGVGPEVILKALDSPFPARARLVIIGDLLVFAQTAKRLKRRLPAWRVVSPQHYSPDAAASRVFIDTAHRGSFKPGQPTVQAGRAALDYLDLAIGLARRGWVEALVTAPVTKRVIERAGAPFTGHTEYLARELKAKSVVMLFDSPTLRVVLLTRHLALRRVASQATARLIRDTLMTTAQGLRTAFGIRRPRLAVLGLNPHAGEDGLFGHEEQTILLPAMRACQGRGMRLEGPYAADGFFAAPHDADAVICWYHDQGLIPFKLMARDAGCQMTLGLPIIRTSPDHGSALDIAGQGRANPGSMRYALRLAAKLVRRGKG